MRMKIRKRTGPTPIAPHGQPGEARTTGDNAKGQGAQPGHPALDLHPKTGKGGARSTVTTVGDHPRTVKHRIHAPASHHRMRTEGQHLHPSGQHHGGETSIPPFGKPGTQIHQPGHPHEAAQADVGGALSMPNMKQTKVSPYGTPARFKRLKMTPKSGGGSY